METRTQPEKSGEKTSSPASQDVGSLLVSVSAGIQTLQDEKRQLQFQIVDTEEKLKREKESVAQLRLELAQLFQSRKEIEQELQREREVCADERFKAEEIKSVLERSREDQGRLVETDSAMRFLISDLRVKVKTSQEDSGAMRIRVSDVDQEIKHERASLAALRVLQSRTENSYKTQVTKLSDATEELTALRSKYSALLKTEAQLKASQADLEVRLKYAISEVERLHATTFEAQVATEQANKTKNEFEEKAGKVSSAINHLEKHCTEVSAEVDRLTRLYEEAAVEREQLRTENQRLQLEVNGSMQTVSEKTGELQDVISSLEKQSSHATGEVDRLTKLLGESAPEREHLKIENQRLQLAVTGWMDAVSEKTLALTNLENEVAKSTREHQALQEQSEKIQRELAILKDLRALESEQLVLHKESGLTSQRQLLSRDQELQKLKELSVSNEAMRNTLWQELLESQSLLKLHKLEITRLNAIINLGHPESNVIALALEKPMGEWSAARKGIKKLEEAIEKEKQLLQHEAAQNVSVAKGEVENEPSLTPPPFRSINSSQNKNQS